MKLKARKASGYIPTGLGVEVVLRHHHMMLDNTFRMLKFCFLLTLIS